MLHTIRSRSGGRFSTRHVAAQLDRFHALTCELMDKGASRADVERIGEHIRHGGVPWSKKPDIGLLISEAKDQRGPQLPRLLTDMDGCDACRRGDGQATPHDLPPPPPRVDVSSEERASPAAVVAARPHFYTEGTRDAK